jgi:hypothetical protein
MSISERVAAGAAFLDEHDPEWWRPDVERAIDLEQLELSNGGDCILGQRCPLESVDWRTTPYASQAARLSGQTFYGAWASSRGFDIDPFGDQDGGDEYDDLTAEWRRVITGRRAAS